MPGFRTNCSVRQGLALALQPSENAVYVAYTQKFEQDPEHPVYILTVHGQGYKFAPP